MWSNRSLIMQFTRREIEGRYRGTFLGLAWSFLTPVVMLIIYTFVFGVVYKARWINQRTGDSLAGFALVMFAGQLAFQAFSEPVSKASALITGVPNFVKKVIFPLDILPVVIVGAALYHVAIGLFIAMIVSLFVNGNIPWTAFLVPLALLPLAMLGLGCAWFLSSLGVYLRDTGYAVNVVLQVLFFATPIFFSTTSVPEPYRSVVEWNPLCSMIELVRGVLVFNDPGTPKIWLSAFLIGLVSMTLGKAWFKVTRKGFADVM